MVRPATLLRTLWYLKPQQWRGQLRRVLSRSVQPLRWDGAAPELAAGTPPVQFLGAPGHVHCTDLTSLRLLNQTVAFGDAIDWEPAAPGPLWRYQLHQFDWIRSSRISPELRAVAIRDWIARHPAGTGWDGGPTSLRIIVWLKLLLASDALPDDGDLRGEMVASLADQLATLEANPETHLLGNHYLWNLLALVFAGVALRGELADRALAYHPKLLAELDEEFGADGAHYERSPMYHGLLLEHMLDFANVMRAAPGRAPAGLREAVEAKVAAMRGALSVWTHPDGRIALFGDAALGMAPLPAQLQAYGDALGIPSRPPQEPGVLRDAGFVRLEDGPFVLLASTAPPSPSYQPGHAHCDALSFELSVSGRRVVTDTGVAEYTPGPLRDHARSTAAHATVQIGGEEQAEVWAAHRVGGRPDVALIEVEPGRSAVAVCAGYATPEVLHRRRFEVTDAGVRIEDEFDLPAPTAILRLPLAPEVEPDLEYRVATIPLGERRLMISLPAEADWIVERAAVFNEFGLSEERAVLTGRATNLASASWNFTLA